jgi:phospholipid/cholesterol/gamma-HCH transport system permease protein
VGVEPIGFVCAVAVFVGISVVVQLAFWTGEAGQSQLLGPLLVAVVARELGPILTNVVVIVRSSSAMATELGVLKINGEVQALEARGCDPFLHLVLPRVLGGRCQRFA